jgi:hypothetical protein
MKEDMIHQEIYCEFEASIARYVFAKEMGGKRINFV